MIMASALRSTGSTRQWRKLRAAMEQRLVDHGALPCWRCGLPVTPDMPWNLGHVVDRALGGDDSALAPEHRRCSDSSGTETKRKIAYRRSSVASITMRGEPGDLFGH